MFYYRTRRDSQESNCDSLSRQAAIRISHSLPDLQTEPLKQEYVQEHKDPAKKVNAHKIKYSSFITIIFFGTKECNSKLN